MRTDRSTPTSLPTLAFRTRSLLAHPFPARSSLVWLSKVRAVSWSAAPSAGPETRSGLDWQDTNPIAQVRPRIRLVAAGQVAAGAAGAAETLARVQPSRA